MYPHHFPASLIMCISFIKAYYLMVARICAYSAKNAQRFAIYVYIWPHLYLSCQIFEAKILSPFQWYYDKRAVFEVMGISDYHIGRLFPWHILKFSFTPLKGMDSYWSQWIPKLQVMGILLHASNYMANAIVSPKHWLFVCHWFQCLMKISFCQTRTVGLNMWRFDNTPVSLR